MWVTHLGENFRGVGGGGGGLIGGHWYKKIFMGQAIYVVLYKYNTNSSDAISALGVWGLMSNIVEPHLEKHTKKEQ